MLFAVFCIDKPGMETVRGDVLAAHQGYMETGPVEVVMSGPLATDDRKHMIGSLFVLEASDRAAIEEFHKGDPFVIAGVWNTVDIRAFNLRVDNRGRREG